MKKYLVTFVYSTGACIDIEVEESSVYTAHLTALMQVTRQSAVQAYDAEIVATRISLMESLTTREEG